jgi:hypothetical protein
MNPYDYTTSAPLQEPLHCGSCGKPAPELFTPYWDQRIKVGPCCTLHADEFQDEPVCPEVLALAREASTVAGLTRSLKFHFSYCRVCNPALLVCRRRNAA